MNYRDILIDSFRAAVAAADPARIVPAFLPTAPKGRTLVVGAGKAAAAMAAAVEQHWPRDSALSGTVITRYGHSLPTKRIRVVEAGHPIPDTAGEAASAEILQQVQSLGPDDLLLALISGGGSSLLSLPSAGITMSGLKNVTQQLLRSGAAIQEMNTVRKHLSLIQGGRLAAASPAPVHALIISDVTGDDPTHIASGPCAPDPTRFQDALEILERYDVRPGKAVMRHLIDGANGVIAETPKPGDPLFKRVVNSVIASAHDSLLSAAAFLEKRGIPAVILGDTVTGEAREVAKPYAALVRQIRRHQLPWSPPVALLSGGECTVTVKDNGHGGRCTEFLLSLSIELGESGDVWAIACDTDGIDGSEDNAGAVLTPDTIPSLLTQKMSPKKLLAQNNAWTAFHATNDLVITGPTRTNVNDYRAILIT